MEETSGNLFSLFYYWCAKKKDSPFIFESDGKILSYGEFERLSARFAEGLERAGVVAGERLLAQLPKTAQTLALYFGCLRSGIVYVPINPAAPEAESLRLVDDSRCAAVICDPESALANCPLAPSIRRFTVTRDGAGSLLRDVPTSPSTHGFRRLGDGALAAILYTSGSSGAPKGVMLPHRALLTNTGLLRPVFDCREDDVFLHALPLFNSHGLSLAVNSMVAAGGSFILLNRFDVSRIVEDLPRATVFSGVPTMYARLLADPCFGAAQCSSMRLFVSSSATLQEHLAASFLQRTGHALLELYGLTETGTLAANPPRAKRPGSVGKALPGIELRTVDDEGNPLPASTRGRLQIRKADISPGYWRNGAVDPLPLVDGFYDTEDIVDIDADGYISVVGRTKDVVISGGFNIYPREVENALATIAGVRDCAVIGVPHRDLGEVPVAIVVSADPSRSEDELLRKAGDLLGRYKLPRRIFFVDALPQNTSGKPDLLRLRDAYRTAFMGQESTPAA